MHAQVLLLLNSFRYDWATGLVLFGIHLVLLGGLICWSSYIPRIIGVLLVIDGFGSLSPYLFTKAHLRYISITFFGELVFMLWLLIKGWKIKVKSRHFANNRSFPVCRLTKIWPNSWRRHHVDTTRESTPEPAAGTNNRVLSVNACFRQSTLVTCAG